MINFLLRKLVQNRIKGFGRIFNLLIKMGYTPRIKARNKYGAWFLLNPFNYIDSIVLADGYYESEVLECILSQVKKNEVFWDIGANIGLHSITLHHLNKDIQIFSFEPYPSILECFIENARLNASAINKMSVGLSNKSDLLKLHYNKGNSGMTTLHPWHEFQYDDYVNIPTITIDDLIYQYNIPAPNVIKIDTEGSEFDIFNGASKFLEETHLHSIIFEADNDFLETDSALKKYLMRYGFSFNKLQRKEESTIHNLSNFLAVR